VLALTTAIRPRVDLDGRGRAFRDGTLADPRAVRCDDLARAGEAKAQPSSLLGPDPVGGDSENAVLEGARDHRRLAVRHDKVGRMGEDLGPRERQGSRRLREAPVEADHEADSRPGERNRLEREIPGIEPLLLVIEETIFL
jgi:hypothetical protein